MMRTRLAFGLALLFPFLTGCNGISLAEAPESTAPTPKVEAPDLTAKTSLRLVRETAPFEIGETIEELYNVFGDPRTSTEFSSLPKGFEEPYTAKGWQTAREGLGAILYENKVVAVMRQLTRATQEEFDQIVQTTTQANPSVKPKVIQGTRVVYYFWEERPQRIMIVGLNTRNDAWHITEAMGDDTVMDNIGANPEKATLDEATVDAKLGVPKS